MHMGGPGNYCLPHRCWASGNRSVRISCLQVIDDTDLRRINCHFATQHSFDLSHKTFLQIIMAFLVGSTSHPLGWDHWAKAKQGLIFAQWFQRQPSLISIHCPWSSTCVFCKTINWKWINIADHTVVVLSKSIILQKDRVQTFFQT